MWPNSSTTSCAVSWSMGWLMVAITPIFIIVLMTSLALTAMRLASSPTVIVSGICTSRLTGAVGCSKPWRRVDAAPGTGRRCRPATAGFFLKRALASPATCSSWRPYLVGAPLRGPSRRAAGALDGAARRHAPAPPRGARPRRVRAPVDRARAVSALARRASASARARASSSARRRASCSRRSRSRRSASRCSASRRSRLRGARPPRPGARGRSPPAAAAALPRAPCGSGRSSWRAPRR